MSPAKSEAEADDHAEIWSHWQELVNMTPASLDKWLDTGESKSVGFKEEDRAESVGHKSGKRIVAIKHKKKADLTEDDWKHMAKVIGYIKRHKAQGGPEKDVETSPWLYSLKNWGHDPTKESG